MMRIAAFSSAPIFGGLRRLRFGAVLFGIGAIREKPQRRFMHLCGDAIGRWPVLLVTDDGPVECRLLSTATEVDPSSDAAGWRFILDAALNLGVVKTLQEGL
jgi:hypothetical protein